MLISELNTMDTVGVFCLVRLGAPAYSRSWGEKGQITLGNRGQFVVPPWKSRVLLPEEERKGIRMAKK